MAATQRNLTIDFFLLGLDHPIVNAWFGGMYSSFFNALRELGCTVTYSAKTPNKDADILVVTTGGSQDKSSAIAMQAFDGPVILYVGPAKSWFRQGFLERWRDRILFVYGIDMSNFTTRMYANIGIPYFYLPFASDPVIMRPLKMQKLYDVVFVGNAGSGSGRHNYVKPLMHVAHSRKMLFIGPGWERYGFPNQSIAWGNLLNILYNLTNICINISNDEERVGKDLRLDANPRLFDLAMAGCLQVSNAPQVVRPYFDESEVIAVDRPDEWVSAIMYYLEHPEETESFRIAARDHALAEHTWNHRAKQFLAEIEKQLSIWKGSIPTASILMKMVRLRDTTLPSYGLQEGIGKLKRLIMRRLYRYS